MKHDGLKITQGTLMLMDCPVTPPGNPRQHGFWRWGVRKEVHEWLLEFVGQTCGRVEWEQGQGSWIFTGTQMSSWRRPLAKTPVRPPPRARFWFREAHHATLFKLTWM